MRCFLTFAQTNVTQASAEAKVRQHKSWILTWLQN